MSKPIKSPQELIAKLRREPHWALAGVGLFLAFVYGISGMSTPEAPGPLTLAARLAMALVVVLGLLYLGARILQGTRGWLPTARPRKITLQETLSLGPRRALYLVCVGNRQFLVGATEHNLTLISEITEETQQPAPAVTTSNAEALPVPFATLLTQHLTDIPKTR